MTTFTTTDYNQLQQANLLVDCSEAMSAEVLPLVKYLTASTTLQNSNGNLLLGDISKAKHIPFGALFAELKLKQIEVDIDKMSVTKVTAGGYAFSTKFQQFCILSDGLSNIQLDSGEFYHYDRQSLVPISKKNNLDEFFPTIAAKKKVIEGLKNNALKLNIGDICMVKPYDTLVALFGENGGGYINSASSEWGAPFYKGHSWICSRPLRVTGYNEGLGVYYAELIDPITGVTHRPGAVAGTILYTSFMENVDSFTEIPALPLILHESLLVKV